MERQIDTSDAAILDDVEQYLKFVVTRFSDVWQGGLTLRYDAERDEYTVNVLGPDDLIGGTTLRDALNATRRSF